MTDLSIEQIASTAERKEKKKRGFWQRNRSQVPLTLMCLPGVILTFMFAYMPMFGIIIAFKKFKVRDGIWGSPWNGLDNFSYLFKTHDAFIMVRNTLLYNAVFIIVGIALAVILAIGLNLVRQKRISKVYQTIMIMPHFLSMVIVSYLVLAFLNMENGFLNNSILPMFGMNPVNWYVEEKPWPFILTFVHFWKCIGYDSIIYLAAIAGIDIQLYEAAEIDGASTWKTVWHITLPLLKNVICIKLILAMGHIFGGDFGLFYQVPMNSGALADVTTTIPVYVYRSLTAGSTNSIGLGSAVSFIQSVVGCFLVVVTNAIVNKISSGENGMF